MKRAYKPLTVSERLDKADEEAYFDLPDGPLRSDILRCIKDRAVTPETPTQKWFEERYLWIEGGIPQRTRSR